MSCSYRCRVCTGTLCRLTFDHSSSQYQSCSAFRGISRPSHRGASCVMPYRASMLCWAIMKLNRVHVVSSSRDKVISSTLAQTQSDRLNAVTQHAESQYRYEGTIHPTSPHTTHPGKCSACIQKCMREAQQTTRPARSPSCNGREYAADIYDAR